MSTNLENRARERQRKIESRRQASESTRKRERDLEQEINNKGDIFLLEEQHENFAVAVRK